MHGKGDLFYVLDDFEAVLDGFFGGEILGPVAFSSACFLLVKGCSGTPLVCLAVL